jgi:hypothetical protein
MVSVDSLSTQTLLLVASLERQFEILSLKVKDVKSIKHRDLSFSSAILPFCFLKYWNWSKLRHNKHSRLVTSSSILKRVNFKTSCFKTDDILIQFLLVKLICFIRKRLKGTQAKY